MDRILTPADLRVIGNVFMKISRAPWFEPSDAGPLAFYLIHQYARGHDEMSLEAVAKPFAREWFPIGRERFDSLAALGGRGLFRALHIQKRTAPQSRGCGGLTDV